MESVKQFELLCDETFLYSKEIRLHYFVCVGIQKLGVEKTTKIWVSIIKQRRPELF